MKGVHLPEGHNQLLRMIKKGKVLILLGLLAVAQAALLIRWLQQKLDLCAEHYTACNCCAAIITKIQSLFLLWGRQQNPG